MTDTPLRIIIVAFASGLTLAACGGMAFGLRGAPSRGDVVAALQRAGHDFSVGRLRDAEQALAQGRRREFEAIRQQNFCSVRAAGRDLDLACRYLVSLDAPPAPAPVSVDGRQAAAAGERAGVLTAANVQRLLGQTVVAPDASVAAGLANARCDGYGCFNVWDHACTAASARLLADMRTCDVSTCVRNIRLAAQLELDCARVPPALRRLPDVHPRRELNGFTTRVSSLAAPRITMAIREAEACRSSAPMVLRCLIPSATDDNHDAYVQRVRSLAVGNPIAGQFPGIARAVQSELDVLTRADRVAVERCRVLNVNAETLPQSYFDAHHCSPMTMSNASWVSVQNAYTSRWRAARQRLEAERQAEAERRAAEQRRFEAEAERQRLERERQQELERQVEQARRDAEQRAADQRARREQEQRQLRLDCRRQCQGGCNGVAACVSQCVAQTCP